MIDPVKPHFTTRRGFIAAAGFSGVSLYGLWAAYGAAPSPLALLGLDHSDDAPHGAGEGVAPASDLAMPAKEGAHGGHGGAAPGISGAQAFSRESAEFSERFRLPDGRVYPRRIAMMGSGNEDPHAGHNMAGSTMTMAPAPQVDPLTSTGRAAVAGLDAPGSDQDGLIDVLMTAGKWYYLPAVLRLDAGQRYRFRMMAVDVNHGASVQFGKGARMIRLQPGRVTETELSFARPGKYLVHCAVYCGEAHDVMQASIEVV